MHEELTVSRRTEYGRGRQALQAQAVFDCPGNKPPDDCRVYLDVLDHAFLAYFLPPALELRFDKYDELRACS